MFRLLALLIFCSLNAQATERIEVWTYHTSPPFANEQSTGLSEALVELLNEHPSNHARYFFALRVCEDFREMLLV